MILDHPNKNDDDSIWEFKTPEGKVILQLSNKDEKLTAEISYFMLARAMRYFEWACGFL